MQKPVLYLMVGYPGAGKTTAARVIHELTGAVHLWADKERRAMFGEVYRQEQSSELYDQLNKQAAELLASGKSVVFDTNFNYYKDREHLRSIALEAGAEVVLIWLHVPQELAFERAVMENSGNRMFVTMAQSDFERVANHLEPPGPNEHPIVFDGTKISPEYIKQKLGL